MVMIRTLLFLLIAAPAPAEQLSGADIRALLAGNTAIGVWLGAPYRQLFRSDGTTIYAQKGSRSALGNWRINPATEAFETLWPGGGWTAYGVHQEDGTLFWSETGDDRHPFKMLDGQQLVWPDG